MISHSLLSVQSIIINTMINKPILSFCYTNQPLKSYQDLDQVRSNSSFKTEVFTYRSATSSKTSVLRLNQIKPTSKITVPSKFKESTSTSNQNPKLNPNSLSKKMYTQPEEYLQKPMLTFDPQYSIKQQKQTKGLLGWAGLGLLCGMPSKKQTGDGCTCHTPCQFKQQWTKSHERTDLIAYLKLRALKPTPQHLTQIEKDIHRTYPLNLTFNQQGIFREMLREVLLTYSKYDVELGYVQGLNNITAVLLYHIKDAERTFWALVELMQYQQLRMIYVGKLEYLQNHCRRIQKLISTKLLELNSHMQEIGIDIKIVLHGWLLSLMSKLIPLQEMHIVINSFRKEGWSFVYKVVIVCLKTVKDCLLVTQDQSEFISALSEQSFSQLGLEWSNIFKQANKLQL